ncbi:MAG: FliO/MopB family protein [Gammaproteobacteria bacterium]
MAAHRNRVALAAALIAPAVHAAGPEPIGLASIGQVVLGLAAVLGVLALVTLVLRRGTGLRTGRAGSLKIIDALGVGTRERIVLIDVEGDRVLVGIAPGGMHTLHRRPRGGQAEGTYAAEHERALCTPGEPSP